MGTGLLYAQVGVLVISAALQMSSVTLPTCARSLLPHARSQLPRLEVAHSPAHPAAMGLPEEEDPLLQERCPGALSPPSPPHRAPLSLPCVGQQGEGAAPCLWETQGAVQEEGTSSWL